MMNKPNSIAVAEAEPSKSTHCYAIEKKRVKKTLLTQPVEFYLLLPGVFFMIFDHTTHIHSAASSQIFFFQRKKTATQPTNMENPLVEN